LNIVIVNESAFLKHKVGVMCGLPGNKGVNF